MRINQNSYSRAGLAAAFLCATVALLLVGAVWFNLRAASVSAVAVVAAAPTPAPAAAPDALADAKMKLVFAAGFHRDDDVSQSDAFDAAMTAAKFHKSAPTDPETGEPQNGYFARSLFDAFDYMSMPYADPNDAWRHSTELNIYSKDGQLHGNFSGSFHTYRFDDGGEVQPVTMNIAFDLPSGGHKYMKAVGYQATDGGVVIDDSFMPQILAYIMVSKYMHIYVPSFDTSGKTELVYWTDSFKGLLNEKDRQTAELAQARLDKANPVSYDHEDEEAQAPSQPNGAN